jgi:AraC-like DNA-binding protein
MNMASHPLRRNVNGVVIMAKVAQERGLSLRAFFAGTGLRASDVDSATATITFEQEFQLIRNLLRHCGDPVGLGLEVGRQYQFTSLASVGFAVISSPTLRAALDILLRYADLNISLVRMTLGSDAADLRIGLADAEVPADLRRFAIERVIGATVKINSDLLGRTVIPRAVEFSFAQPPGAAAYQDMIGITPSFATAESALILKSADVDAPHAHANPLALRLAEETCRQYLSEWKVRRGLAAQVRDHLSKQPGDIVEMAVVASALHMSTRTLRRRLQEEGTSYLALCDEVRQAIAEQLLAMPRMPIDQVAERLGYSEAASFIHAFKRWNGQTPQAFRRSLAAAIAGSDGPDLHPENHNRRTTLQGD